jgi:hypothetical protein
MSYASNGEVRGKASDRRQHESTGERGRYSGGGGQQVRQMLLQTRHRPVE